MAKPKLHLDADASLRALHRALLARGHDVTRTPLDASDEYQLLGATAHGRCVFTFNIRDFTTLSQRYTQHAGIILAAQQTMSLAELIDSLDRLLSTTGAAELAGQVRWLADWRR